MPDLFSLSLFDDLPSQAEEPASVPVAPARAAATTSAHAVTPTDQKQRDRAIDVTRSVIVQAPAGSGKTDLLTRRYLALLADAEISEPEQILAITFTRAATAEMRARILADLHAASAAAEDGILSERVQLARRALDRAQRLGWKLLEQPERLQIETIDSLCMRIAHGQPLLARLGGKLQPVDQADALYAEAARRTLGQLGGPDTLLSDAIAHLLQLRDNNLPDCERLIAGMLAQRDQWEHAFPLAREVDWDEVRTTLEAPFQREVRRVLTAAHQLLAQESWAANELMAVANYACSNRDDDALALLAQLDDIPTPSSGVEHWQCLCDFLLTSSDDWRKKFTASEGFPPARNGALAKQWNERRDKVLSQLRSVPGLLAALCAVRALPKPRYDEDQWITLVQLFTTLRQAAAELRVLFAERGEVDFVEISRAALQVLEHTETGLAWSERTGHLLVDEFQDTSRRQHKLLSALLAAWTPGDKRTCFFVGDPMQSIYMFRQAEVELFEQVKRQGILSAGGVRIECESLELSVNFRSHRGLIDPLNGVFDPVFATNTPAQAAPVSFSPSTAAIDQSIDTVFTPPLQVHAQVVATRDPERTEEEKQNARQREAETIVEIIGKHAARMAHAEAAGEEYRIAVLVRSRGHLASLLPLLRQRGIPFRAVEIESLAERQELLDLMALIRALLHPMDRVAWLAVLRAPWCGLTLAELHALTGADDPLCRRTPMPALIERNLPLLEPTAQLRVERTLNILRRAANVRFRQSPLHSISAWIERTWRSLGGPACMGDAERENAQVFFTLLDSVSPDGAALLSGVFERELERLYAQPDPRVSERCGVQLMTIHKAKGLGFDAVIVPALERKSGQDSASLICSLERLNPWSGKEEFLIAPIGLKGGDTHPLYRWVRQQRQHRFNEERKRLFYVACTRARQELHVLGTAELGSKGLRAGASDSLLSTAWPALYSYFEEAAARSTAEIVPFPVTEEVAEKGDDILLEIAAQAESADAANPPLRRIPLSATLLPVPNPENVTTTDTLAVTTPAFRAVPRPAGSRRARLLGSTLHLLLQRLGPEIAQGQAQQLRQRIESLLRPYALPQDQMQSSVHELTEMVETCAADPVARWILADHAGARSEASWTGWLGGSLKTVRADRVFLAGAQPLEPAAPDGSCLWIVDYKTSAPGAEEEQEFLTGQRLLYEPQLEAYAEAVRRMGHETAPLRLGLYYPRARTNKFDWWEG
jgi:ATP-dependent helicase/nuclease subunit A